MSSCRVYLKFRFFLKFSSKIFFFLSFPFTHASSESWTHNLILYPIIMEEEVPFELKLIACFLSFDILNYYMDNANMTDNMHE